MDSEGSVSVAPGSGSEKVINMLDSACYISPRMFTMVWFSWVTSRNRPQAQHTCEVGPSHELPVTALSVPSPRFRIVAFSLRSALTRQLRCRVVFVFGPGCTVNTTNALEYGSRRFRRQPPVWQRLQPVMIHPVAHGRSEPHRPELFRNIVVYESDSLRVDRAR